MKAKINKVRMWTKIVSLFSLTGLLIVVQLVTALFVMNYHTKFPWYHSIFFYFVEYCVIFLFLCALVYLDERSKAKYAALEKKSS